MARHVQIKLTAKILLVLCLVVFFFTAIAFYRIGFTEGDLFGQQKANSWWLEEKYWSHDRDKVRKKMMKRKFNHI